MNAVLQTAELFRSPGVTVAAQDDYDVDPAIPLFSRGARRRANVRVIGRLEGAACWPDGGRNNDCVAAARVWACGFSTCSS